MKLKSICTVTCLWLFETGDILLALRLVTFNKTTIFFSTKQAYFLSRNQYLMAKLVSIVLQQQQQQQQQQYSFRLFDFEAKNVARERYY